LWKISDRRKRCIAPWRPACHVYLFKRISNDAEVNQLLFGFTSPPHERRAKHCNQRVRLSVCYLTHVDNCMSELHEMFLRRQCNVSICTPGFVDDAMSAHNGTNGQGSFPVRKKNRNAKNMASAGSRAYMGVWGILLPKRANLSLSFK